MALLSDSEPSDDAPAAEGPVRVLYIGGTGRTGSTLLERLLGQLPGVFNAGELTWLWYALLGDGRCSCGERLVDCPVWKAVFDWSYGGMDGVDARENLALRRLGDSRHLPLMLMPGGRRRLLARLGGLPERLERLYLGIRAVTGAHLIVDSSKEPHYSWILRSRPALDITFLHLVRDPRAIAHSWARTRPEQGFDGRVLLERRGIFKSAVYHDVSNAAAEAIWSSDADHYLRMRYEDLIASPVEAVERIADLLGLRLDLSGVVDGTVAVLNPTHSAWGNPNRFEFGSIDLRADEEWRSSMSVIDRVAMTALTMPFMLRYGYPLRPGGRREHDEP